MTMNYNIGRSEDATTLNRDHVLIIIPPVGDINNPAPPYEKSLGDLLAEIEAGDIAATENDTALVLDDRGAISWGKVGRNQLNPTLQALLLPVTGSARQIIVRNAAGTGWEVDDVADILPSADRDNAGVIETASPTEMREGTSDDVAVTPHQFSIYVDGRLLPIRNSGNSGRVLFADGDGNPVWRSGGADGQHGNDGWTPVLTVQTDGARRVLYLQDYIGGEGTKPSLSGSRYVGVSGYVASASLAVDIRGAQGAAGATGSQGATGATGSAGATGAAGSDAYVVVRYQRTTGGEPVAPASNSDSNWSATYTAPDSTNTRAYMAFKSGIGTDPNNATGWTVILIAQYLTSGGSTPPSNHRRWFSWGADNSFPVSEMTTGNAISADGETITVTGVAASRAAPQYIAIWSAQALTFISHSGTGLGSDTNIITTTFLPATRLTIASTNGYLYVSRLAQIAPGAVNGTWTTR